MLFSHEIHLVRVFFSNYEMMYLGLFSQECYLVRGDQS